MLIALVTFLLLSGSGAGSMIQELKAAEKAVQVIVVDEASRDAAVETIDEMMGVVQEFNKVRTDTFMSFEGAASTYESTAADLQALLDRERDLTVELQDRLVTLHSELKTHMTEEEWNQMYAALNGD